MLTHRSDVLVVLGLPQCGTSSVSQALSYCGAKSTPIEELAEAQQALLSSAGNGWDSPLELADRSLNGSEAQLFKDQLENTFDDVSAESCAMACIHGMERILPLWQTVLERKGHHVRHVLVVRHPLDVVNQFRRTNNWDRDHALLVWMQSTLAMERHSRNKSRVVIDGEKLNWDIDGTLNLIEHEFKLELPQRNHKTLIEIEKSQSNFEVTQNHTAASSGNEGAGSHLLDIAIKLYYWLLAEQNSQPRLRQLPDAIRQQLLLSESMMGRTLNDFSIQNNSLKKQLRELQARRSVRFSDWLHRINQKAA